MRCWLARKKIWYLFVVFSFAFINIFIERDRLLPVNGGQRNDPRQAQSPLLLATVSELDTLLPVPDDRTRRSVDGFNELNETTAPNDRIRACFFVLLRNSDLSDWLFTMRQLEAQFNVRHNYAYVFFNELPFSDEFRRAVLAETRARVDFGLVPAQHWSVPDWIDRERMERNMRRLKRANVFRATVLSYHHMCRFYSGFFYRHALMAQYDYYWRVEPNVSFPCRVGEDPFRTMRDQRKLYGFVVARAELPLTTPSLWRHIEAWLAWQARGSAGAGEPRAQLALNNTLAYLRLAPHRQRVSQTTCTFFNNFEIGALALFRAPAYTSYFDYLDRTGGFFYERWGDSAVRTFFMLLMLNRSQIHHFNSIGYYHKPYYVCPALADKLGECACNKTLIRSTPCNWRWEHLDDPRLKRKLPYQLETFMFKSSNRS